ncbi:MAG: hypothetical protein IPI46_02660 [Bacteroidetes bacterium]|nr:hypothetical protein [Bacteroidota bacterium]
MQKILIIICLIVLPHVGFSQFQFHVNEMNKAINFYSADQAKPMTFFQPTGSLEQPINEFTLLKIRLALLGEISVATSSLGFNVNISCTENEECFSLLKHDSVSTPIPSNTFFFTNAKAANSFASNLAELALKFDAKLTHGKATLLDDGTKTDAINPVVKAKPKTEEIPEETEEPQKVELSKSTESRKPVQSKKKVEEKENDEDEVEKETPVKKSKVVAEEANQDAPPQELICKHLFAVIKSGKEQNFKDIEGTETNSERKINDSKLKIKGAKRNYLSWYKSKRAFLAEFKTSTEFELIAEEFGLLQTQLEDCLDGNWEDTDHSSDEIYANSTNEVKDVEYIHQSDKSLPHLRILIHTENGKHTLFIRIQ